MGAAFDDVAVFHDEDEQHGAGERQIQPQAPPLRGTLVLRLVLAGADGAQAFEFHFDGDRAQVRRQAVDAALTALVRCMEGAQA